ncbi:unnamed protein product, partial [Phyllotreta striolata]
MRFFRWVFEAEIMRGIDGIRVHLLLELLLPFLLSYAAKGAVVAPPWANPKLNPCASHPRGWQLLFWPPDGKCYKIFQVGYPCPNGMELTPSLSKSGQTLSAECRCVPGTAQSASDGACYRLFTAGPCQMGQYFGPDTQYKSENSKRQWGTCKPIKTCSSDDSTLYWPKDGKCYEKHTKGPCPKGQLLTIDRNSSIPTCKCDDEELRIYRHFDGSCYRHYTKGPCLEKGQLYLPDKTCGCHPLLPNYHEPTRQCFELGTPGPCARGQHYVIDDSKRAECACKPSHVRHRNTTACYRLYTRGPCPEGRILLDADTCARQPCARGSLYFPDENRCHRVGARGPCSPDRVVAFDFEARPSVDGLSYNGVCACALTDCEGVGEYCDRLKGLVRYRGECHKMYTRGPCARGSWLVPKRNGRDELFVDGTRERVGTCECIPGYARKSPSDGDAATVTSCLSPAVALAEYLNGNRTRLQVDLGS